MIFIRVTLKLENCMWYFNPVGAHESALIGEDSFDVLNNLYPRITKVALGKLREIKIYGSNWPTPMEQELETILSWILRMDILQYWNIF